MIGRQDRSQRTLFIPGDVEDLIPDDHILKRVDRVLDHATGVAEKGGRGLLLPR